MSKGFSLLLPSDGSPSAKAALRVARRFPWPGPVHTTGLVALADSAWSNVARRFRTSLADALQLEAQNLRQRLLQDWADSTVVERNESPATAILNEARRMPADAIVMGWRGHGTFKRLLAGSVSRRVVAAAPCPVVVARSAPARMRRFVIGFDGKPPSRRAIRFLCRLKPEPRNLAVVVTVVDPMPFPRMARLPRATREALRAEVVRINRRSVEQARRKADRAAAVLRRAGWRVQPQVILGAPLTSLLGAASETAAHALVVGARATSGVARLLLGSVASGALDRAPTPVVIVP